MGRARTFVLLSLLAAASSLLAFVAQPAQAAEGNCAPTPADVVPNPLPPTPWKDGGLLPPCGTSLDDGSDAATPGGAPREPIDVPPNPEPRKEPVAFPAQDGSPAVQQSAVEGLAPVPPLATSSPETCAKSSLTEKTSKKKQQKRKSKLRQAGTKPGKPRAAAKRGQHR